jgi:hypothetical protein
MVGGSFATSVTDLSLLDAFIIRTSNSGNIFAVASDANTSEAAGTLQQNLFCSLFFRCK